MKKSATIVFSLLFAVGLSTARSQDGAIASAAPEASIGALTYDEVYALYSYLDFKDDIDGDGNGITVNGRFSNKQNFFSEIGLNWFNTEITQKIPSYNLGGRSYGGGETTVESDIISLNGGIGSWLPITENFHIVGSGGVGISSISTDGGDTTDVTLQGDVIARWLVFGFIELNGGYTISYSNEAEDVFHGPIYGGSVNISKTWQLILRARLLNDDYNEYGLGVRYRW